MQRKQLVKHIFLLKDSQSKFKVYFYCNTLQSQHITGLGNTKFNEILMCVFNSGGCSTEKTTLNIDGYTCSENHLQ